MSKNTITREEYVNGLASEILKTAYEELDNNPLVKIASEEQINGVVVEKIAGMYDSAEAIYKQASETIDQADKQEAYAREKLASFGIDADAVIAAAMEKAAEEAAEDAETEAEHDEEEDEEDEENEEDPEDKDKE